MTREQAERFIDEKLWDGHGGGLEKRWVDIFTHLGMLKLDEPKDVENRAATLFWVERLPANHILNALDRAGLKIVEK
jgi:hypothetical protein